MAQKVTRGLTSDDIGAEPALEMLLAAALPLLVSPPDPCSDHRTLPLHHSSIRMTEEPTNAALSSDTISL